MVVIDMNFQTRPLNDVCKLADSAGLAGVHQHKPLDRAQIHISNLHYVVKIDHRFDEKVSQVLFLGAREDHKGSRIELLRRQHRRKGIKVCIHMGCYNGDAS